MIEFSRWPQSLGHAPTLSILGAATFLAGAAGLGAAGLTASIYLQRDTFDSLILECKNIGGNAFLTETI